MTLNTIVSSKQVSTGFEERFQFVLNQHGKPYAITNDSSSNCIAYEIGGKAFNDIIQETAFEGGKLLKRNELDETNSICDLKARRSGKIVNIFSRVAPSEGGGIEIDIRDEENTRIKIANGLITFIKNGSIIPFARNPNSRPMLVSHSRGDINLLKKYLRCSDPDFLMLTAFLAYTIATPKIKASRFLFLVLLGDSGLGKSSICDNVIIPLVDNSIVGIQSFPKNEKELGIATQNSHIACFDNVRHLSTSMSDSLCKLSTGNSLSSRKLYSDDDQHVTHLHSAVVLNGISSFVTEPDLAQRCLTIELKPMAKENRKSDAQMMSDLEVDLPIIFRGLLELIAGVFMQLPNVEVTNPERMYDFVRFLSAMEKVQGAPDGVYQGLYSSKLHEDQMTTLFDDPLGGAMMKFCSEHSYWQGLPQDLHASLHEMYRSNRFISGLPTNPSAFSKRLRFISANLLKQGIRVEFGRAKHRLITIEVLGGSNDY